MSSGDEVLVHGDNELTPAKIINVYMAIMEGTCHANDMESFSKFN